MNLPTPGQYIDFNGKRLVSIEEISRRFVCLLTESEALQLFDDEQTVVYRWDYEQKIVEMVKDQKYKLRAELSEHITNATDEFDLSNFQGGYCFIASRWIANGGKPILVLHCQH